LLCPELGRATIVSCAGAAVGNLSATLGGSGVSALFQANTSLSGAEAACGANHFNWYQVVTADTLPPITASGHPLSAPYVDPPAGGYSTLWADNLPWYWNETAPAPGTPHYSSIYSLSAWTSPSGLKFQDLPSGGSVSFQTWLVGLNANSSFEGWYGGFSWQLLSTGVSSGLSFFAAGAIPTAQDYQQVIGAFATAVPEPSIVALVAIGLPFLLARGRRRAGAAS